MWAGGWRGGHGGAVVFVDRKYFFLYKFRFGQNHERGLVQILAKFGEK